MTERFRDGFISREHHFSPGTDRETGGYYLSAPVSGFAAAAEWEACFSISADQFARFRVDPSTAERAALIGTELDTQRVEAMFEEREGASPAHTTFSGSGQLRYRSLPATEFGRIGLMSELHHDLAARLALAISGNTFPPVANRFNP